MPKKKIKKHTGLTKAELTLLAELLEMVSDDDANEGNEYFVSATEANKDLMARVVETTYKEGLVDEALQEIADAKDEILTCDSLLMAYFAERCRHLAKS